MALCKLGHELVDGTCYICTTEGRFSVTFLGRKGAGVVSGKVVNKVIAGVLENSQYDLKVVTVVKDGEKVPLCPVCNIRTAFKSTGRCGHECRYIK